MITVAETVLLYGPPCSGKSTVARYLEKRLGWRYVSVGALTRDEISKRTPVGLKLKHSLESVVEYPLDLIAGLVESNLQKTCGTSVLDGYPKYRWEAERFVRFSSGKGLQVKEVLILEADLVFLLDRVTKRRICSDCSEQVVVDDDTRTQSCIHCGGVLVPRSDDDSIAFARRYGDYKETISDTLDELRVLGIHPVSIDASKSQEEVIQAVERHFLPK